MSLGGAGGGGRPISPASSGRASPVPRSTRRAVEGDLFKADKSLRRYAANIERALSTWEISPEEWADYIAFLARLLKAIQTHPKDVPILPHSTAIAARLAQCLNPALPSGVHQKALEVYAYIFSALGREYISGHLHELLPGLASVLSFASLSVRPALYEILEKYVVQLDPSELRPALKSLILALLPALEEGQGEDFERAFNILHSLEQSFSVDNEDTLSDGDSGGYFWQCLFLAIITSPARRQGALNYLLRSLPVFPGATNASGSRSKPTRMPREAECIVSPEPGLLIRCFVSGLSDPQVLVQRGFLDLLVTNLPLSSTVLQERARKEDLDRLVTAVSQVSLRKDMSLNRRLWSWFLGPEPKDTTDGESSPKLERKNSDDPSSNLQLKYFLAYGRASLERCVLKMLQTSATDVASRARAYRICSSLMDRWEIGGHLVTRVFLPAMRSLYIYSKTAPPEQVAEVVRSASTFFDAVEASLIWGNIIEVLTVALDSGVSRTADLELVRWLVDTFNVRDEEMIAAHIPMTLLYLASRVTSEAITNSARTQIILIMSQLLGLVPARLLRPQSETVQIGDVADTAIQTSIVRFYQQEEQPDSRHLPFDLAHVVSLSGSRICSVIKKSLASGNGDIFLKSANLLLALLDKASSVDVLRYSNIGDALRASFPTSGAAAAYDIPFAIVNHSVLLVAALASAKSRPYLDTARVESLVPGLATYLWTFMSPEQPKYHVEAVRAFWQLEDLVAPSDAVRSSLTALIRFPPAGTNEAEVARRFSVLWTHSVSSGHDGTVFRRASTMPVLSGVKQAAAAKEVLEQPLMLALDALEDPTLPVFEVVKRWLQRLHSLDQVYFTLFENLHACVPIERPTVGASHRQIERQEQDRIRELEYFVNHFQNMLAHGNEWTWQCLSKIKVTSFFKPEEIDGFTALAELCSQMLCSEKHGSLTLNKRLLSVLGMMLQSPAAAALQPLDIDTRLLDILMMCISGNMHSLQGSLLKLLKPALKLRLIRPAVEGESTQSRPSVSAAAKRPSMVPPSRSQTAVNGISTGAAISPPPILFNCIRAGISNARSRYHLDLWLEFIADILPNFEDAIFTNLLPLVETFCKELTAAHEQLASLARETHSTSAIAPEIAIISLLDGLEMILDRAYECLINDTSTEQTPKEAEPRSNFFSSVATGVFKSEGPPSRTATANSRLTVILVLHDAIRVALKMWLWASNVTSPTEHDTISAGTTAYNAFKVRNKCRHLLEQIFAVEPLESLEVIALHWCQATSPNEATSALSLLQVMQVTKPKNVVPAVLDALCTRTNPSAIPASRQSSLTIDLTPAEVATFLSAYLDSTEDDAMDEVWPNCIAFLRDVLANPLPYRQVLSHLLSITLLLAEKLGNTNFGEQRKMRKDLGDTFQRLLTATFTTLPSGYVAESASDSMHEDNTSSRQAENETSMTLLPVLNRVTAKIDLILDTPEKTATAINNITQSLVAPALRARTFPRNVSIDMLQLVVQIARKAPNAKPWRKEVGDALNEPKLLASSPDLTMNGWFPAFHQLSLQDKERMPDLLLRLAPPSSAGIMFGVGANAARLEADRKTQYNLRRISMLFLASPEDSYVPHLRTIEEKMSELFDASPSSSPSAAIKAELFMLCRVLALSISAAHLSPFWPIINDKLQTVLSSLMPDSTEADEFNNFTLLQACKLLDLLVTLSPDEFQLHEWLYITDTIDAVYQPIKWTPTALSDQIADALSSANVDDGMPGTADVSAPAGKRTPLLGRDLGVDREDIKAMAKEDFARVVLRPFLNQLSIHAYEGVYSMDTPDVAALRQDVLSDLLDQSSIVE
ncbi:hypothetical protein CKM354_000156700 [Cercospora kikuchii]|uniref:Protein dopey n=1 Tax=Cercospora kikuchii TaxID=84275 RepID=A0A9P3FCU2_9PEZI|nr:uncharacterized protein CKM354_000156700 [Cercospora kikuchii]GIZ38144.1 hypothetical protein CKM354_000156700 [Cercospora kikuchii]